MHSQKAMLQEAEPEEGSEGRFGRVEGGRAFFWVGNSPSKNVEVAPSMAWAEDAWQEEGLLGEEAQHLQRLESGDWGMRQGCGGQPVTPSRQPCAVPTQGGAGVIIPDSPSGCVVSNTGGRSHLLLPCGNQSLLNKVSTNALLAPGVIDAGRPQWQGADACHMNVPAPGLRGSAASAPASVPGEMGCSHFGARGSEHRDSDLGDGSVPENGLWSELRDSCLATRPDQRSGFCILWGLELIPKSCASQSQSILLGARRA